MTGRDSQQVTVARRVLGSSRTPASMQFVLVVMAPTVYPGATGPIPGDHGYHPYLLNLRASEVRPLGISGPAYSSGGPRFIQSSRSRSALRRDSSARRRCPSRIASSQGEDALFSTTGVGSGGYDGLVSSINRAIIGYSSCFMGCCGRVSLNESSAQPLRFS